MHSSSSSSSPGIPIGEAPKPGGVRRDAGSGGTISVNGPAVNPATPKTSIPSFAAIVSSSSASGRPHSPLSLSTKTPSSTLLRQKHPSSSSSSGPSSPRAENTNDSKNSFINSTSFTTGNSIIINSSTQSTMPSSSAASPLSCMPNNSKGDTPLDNSSDDVDNEQEDSESSDVEIYLDSFGSNNSTEYMHVLSGTNSAYSPGATNTKCNQIPISAYLHPQSPFHLPTQTKTGYTSINEDQGTRSRVLNQEMRGPEPVSILGAYGNGNSIDAHTLNLVSVSNDRTHNSSHSSLSFVRSRNQVPSQQSSSTPGERPPFEVKGTTHAAGPSMVDDSCHRIPQSARMPNPSSSMTIGLAGLSIDGHTSRNSGVATADAGSTRQGQMGMIVSTSQPALNSVRETTPYVTLNGIFTSSASDSALCGLAEGGNGVDATGGACENGNAFSNSCPGVVKTPNVYINGLAPHFPEDELFNLCSEFGPIRSVRTFTRHVKDSESGYGFVLFEAIDDAERCITEIRRRYKNLHPTFSKQIHKIPGTNYTAGPSASWDVSVTGDAMCANASFKAKMESLHDPTSTNLYIEGLPLCIDEASLAILISPHRIVSSRFFQTRLSNPPRIIAFVRLETRAGAEDIIQRLHGQVVKGTNDTGSRIAVRFADTSKQRELRKERAAQEGETSPSRLTIAEASLLNLHGQDFRSETKPMQLVHTGNALSSCGRGFITSVSAPDFSSNGSLALHSNSNFNPPIGLGRTTPGLTGRHSLEMDHLLTVGGLHSRSRSPYAGQFSQSREPFLEASRSNSSIAHLGSGRGYEDTLNDENDFYSQGGRVEHQVYGLPYGQHHLPVSQSVDGMLGQTYTRPSPVYTCSGYTPAEEYIMRTHAESAALAQIHRQQPNTNSMSYQPLHVERGRPFPLALGRHAAADVEVPANIAVGMRAYRAQASLMSPTVSSSTSANSISSFSSAGDLKLGDGEEFGLPSSSSAMTEEDFHAGDPSVTLMTLRNLHASRLSRELRSYQVGQKSAVLSSFLPGSSSTTSLDHDHSTPSPSEVYPASVVSTNPDDTILAAYQQQSANTHMRSTTLPQHRSSAVANGHIRGHHHHSSMSIPKQNLGTPQHASVARLGSSSVLMEESSGAIYEWGVGEKLQTEVGGSRMNSSNSGAHHRNVGSAVPMKTHYSSSAIFGDAEQSNSPASASSSLISPALTYGGQSPSTLSPRTPFSGSFNNAEGFDKTGAEEQQQSGQKEIYREVVLGAGVID